MPIGSLSMGIGGSAWILMSDSIIACRIDRIGGVEIPAGSHGGGGTWGQRGRRTQRSRSLASCRERRKTRVFEQDVLKMRQNDEVCQSHYPECNNSLKHRAIVDIKRHKITIMNMRFGLCGARRIGEKSSKAFYLVD